MKRTDAERAAYWKNVAMQKSSNGSGRGNYQKKPYRNKSAQYYSYKTSENAAKRAEDKEKRDRTKDPGIISAAGSALGTLGGPLTTFLGGKIGHLIEKITGFGDYKVEYNTLMKGGMSPPSVVNSINKGGVIQRHREYICDIKATTGFNIQTFLIQPGLPSTFPWLSQIANSYDQYRLRGMLFEFNSTSSDALLSASTSTALGSVIMSTDYDVADAVPGDKATMLNNEFSCSSKPSLSFIHPIECKRSRSAINTLFTRGAGIPNNFDQRLYDFARFNIATIGMQNNGGILGELWCTYEMEFMKQQVAQNITPFDHFGLSGIIDGDNPMGSSQSRTPNSNLGGTMDAESYMFPEQLATGNYRVTWYVHGAVNVATGITLPTINYTNCSGRAVFSEGTVPDVGTPSPVNDKQSATCQIEIVMTITGLNASIKFTDFVPPAAVVGGDFLVSRVADNID